jgi:hypothetical protein
MILRNETLIEDIGIAIISLAFTAILAIPFFAIVLALWILQMLKDFVLTGKIFP